MTSTAANITGPTLKLYCSECKRWMLDIYGYIEGYAVGKCKSCGEKRLLVPAQAARSPIDNLKREDIVL